MSGSSISCAICKSASHSIQIFLPATHRSVFLQAGCPSCRPTNSVKALKAQPLFYPISVPCCETTTPEMSFRNSSPFMVRFRCWVLRSVWKNRVWFELQFLIPEFECSAVEVNWTSVEYILSTMFMLISAVSEDWLSGRSLDRRWCDEAEGRHVRHSVFSDR